MPSMPRLTDTRCRTAKPADAPYAIQDGRGLYLEVRPTGLKVWRYRYWLTPTRAGRYTIGHYPAVSLGDARKERERIRAMVADGKNPADEKRNASARARAQTANTFSAVAGEWLEQQRAGMAESTYRNVESAIRRNAIAAFGDLPIAEVTPAQVLAMLRGIEDRGAQAMASLVRSRVSAIYRYAIATLRADRDPAAALVGAIRRPRVEHHVALSRAQIGELLKRLETYRGAPETICAIRLLLFTFVRTVELRLAQWCEIDEARAEWRIPAERMKCRLPHLVPLSTQALAELRKLRSLTGHRPMLFPHASRGGASYMAGPTINQALEIMGFNGAGTIGFSAHGFRTTASTLLHELGYRPDVIERQLAHTEANQVRAAYNHAAYLTERREMMQAWGDFCEKTLDS